MKKLMHFFLLGIFTTSCANGQPSSTDGPNSITVTQGGETYRLSVVGDKVPSFTVNGQVVQKEFFDDYEPLFSDLQSRLEEKQKKLAQKARLLTEQVRENLVADLMQDKIISAASAITSFKLDANNFFVNGQKQSFEVFTRYKAKYLSAANQIIQFN